MKNNIIILFVLFAFAGIGYLFINDNFSNERELGNAGVIYTVGRSSYPLYSSNVKQPKYRGTNSAGSSSAMSSNVRFKSITAQMKSNVTDSSTDIYSSDSEVPATYGFYKSRVSDDVSQSGSAGAYLAYGSSRQTSRSGNFSSQSSYSSASVARGISGYRLVGNIHTLGFVDDDGEDDFEEGAGGDNDSGYNDAPVAGGLLVLLLFAALYVINKRRKLLALKASAQLQ